jgi:hypothetical protein
MEMEMPTIEFISTAVADGKVIRKTPLLRPSIVSVLLEIG